MTNDPHRAAPATSPTHDAFQVMFDSFDMMSSVWQPSCKGFGRWQLELAQLNAKQQRAALEFSRNMVRWTSPMDAMANTMSYWQTLCGFYGIASENLTSVVATAAQPQVAFEIVPRPLKKAHDTIVLPDLNEPELPLDRKVA